MKEKNPNILVFVVLLLVVGGVVFCLYYLLSKSDQITSPLDKLNQVPSSITDTPTVNDSNSSQQSSTLPKSSTKNMEKIAKNGDTLIMNYTGKLTNGNVFDSNVDPKFGHVQPFEFTLGAGMVIKGWDEGLVGMKVGEKKTLTITPDKGYGASGHPPVIPPNATLIFDVELVGIK